MFNSNFNKLLGFLFSVNAISTSSSSRVTCKDYTGNDVQFAPFSGASTPSNFAFGFGFNFASFSYSGTTPSLLVLSNGTTAFYGERTDDGQKGGVLLGDGNVEPSANDYCLSGNIITNFTASTSVGIHTTNNSVTVTANYYVTNTGNTPFTVREIGLTTKSIAGDSGVRVLLEHSKLATPVTINPGETKTIVYSISFTP